jgi:hypothetical protein
MEERCCTCLWSTSPIFYCPFYLPLCPHTTHVLICFSQKIPNCLSPLFYTPIHVIFFIPELFTITTYILPFVKTFIEVCCWMPRHRAKGKVEMKKHTKSSLILVNTWVNAGAISFFEEVFLCSYVISTFTYILKMSSECT